MKIISPEEANEAYEMSKKEMKRLVKDYNEKINYLKDSSEKIKSLSRLENISLLY